MAIYMAVLGLLISALPLSLRLAQAAKVPISAASVIDGFCAPTGGGGNGVPYYLADEQGLAGDPAAGKAGTPLTFWSPGFTPWYYPEVFAVIDLGATYTVTSLWGYHEFGNVHVQVTLGLDPLDPALSVEVSTTASPTVPKPIKRWEKSWAAMVNCSVDARYVTLRMYQETTMHELVVYGERKPSPPPPPLPPPPPPRRAPLMRSFLGVNGFADDPVSRLSCAGAVREYQDWIWTEGEGDAGWPYAKNKFSPAYSDFDIDAFYYGLKNASVDVHQCLQGRPWFMSREGNGTVNATTAKWKPVVDADIHNLSAIVDPASYTTIAAHAFQVAARYGAAKVPLEQLQLASGQSESTGLGVLKHIEMLNEPDGWWAGREHFMKPYEIAAMLSAAYDGHEGSLHGARQGVGIKNADPSLQVVMPGVTGTSRKNLDICAMIQLWARSQRKDGRFPADVLNFHGYSTDLKADPTSGRTPEQNNMQQGLAELTAWRDANQPSLAVWLTEFGYDTAQGSPSKAQAYGPYTGDEVQAMWLVRSFMLAAAAKIDRAHVFMLRNVADRGGAKFDTCGLTSSKQTQWQPKLSWYYVSTLTQLLGHMRHTASTLDNSTKLYTAQFDADTGGAGAPPTTAAPASRAFVVWLGTMVDGHVVHELDLGLGGAPAAATLVQLAANTTVGNQSALAVAGGKASVRVGEIPVIVLVGAGPPQPPTGPVPPIDKPVAYACKAANGTVLPTGLYCGDGAPNATAGSSFRVCPSASMQRCPNGQLCSQVAAGSIACVTNPAAQCHAKQPGLYCSTAPKPAKDWPDAYVVCPSMDTFNCPTAAPTCRQDGSTGVSCA